MESTPLELPQEIVNAIVDCAVQNDPEALKPLSLVSRSWSHPTREHLFRAVTIDTASVLCIHERLDALKSLLQDRPLLRHCIKFLTLHYLSRACSCTSDTIEIPSLLTSLTHVVVSAGDIYSRIRPQCLPESLQIALQSLFARPQITSVSLRYIEIDLIPFSQYHHLETLSIEAVSVPEWSHACCFPMNRFPATPGCLRALHLSRIPFPTLRVLLLCSASPEATLSLRGIKELIISTGDLPVTFETLSDEQWGTVFNTLGGAVEIFHLRQASFRKLSSALAPLRCFPNLTQLIVDIVYEKVSNHGHHSSMPTLVQALEELSQLDRPSNLASIRVRYFGCAKYIKREFEDHRKKNLWDRLDRILNARAFSSLHEVVFTLEVYCCESYLDGKQKWEDFADIFHNVFLPRLSRRGVLTLRGYLTVRRGSPFIKLPLIEKTFSR